MVVLFDDSFTSGAQTQDGQTIALEAISAANIIETAGVSDKLTLIPLTTPERLEVGEIKGTESLKGWLKERSPAPIKPNLRSALALADSIFSHSSKFNRELYIVSGFYGGEWDSVDWTPVKGSRTFLLPTGPERLRNVGVEDAKLLSSIRQAGRSVEIEAVFANLGDGATEAAPVSVYLEGERVAQASVDVPEGATVIKKFNLTPPSTGLLAGSIRLDEPDPLLEDNRRYFILDIPDELKLLVVAPDTLTRTIISAALGGNDESSVKITFASPERWEATPLDGFDALLLVDVASLSDAAVDEATDFVKRGGGLIIMPGEESEPSELTRGLLSHLGFGAARGISKGGITWGALDIEHPIFNGVFEDGGSPKPPNLTFAFDFSQAPGDRVVIPLRSGSPFLVERQIGRGRALLFASPPQTVSGELIFSGIFAPLLLRSVAYSVSARAEAAETWETGFVAKPILTLPKAVELQLIGPNGDVTMLPPRPLLGGVEYDVGRITLPGIYDLRDGEHVIARFAANVPFRSSQLIRPSNARLTDQFSGAIILKGSGEEIATSIASYRFGSEFWRPIAFAFMLLLTTESILARPRKDEV